MSAYVTLSTAVVIALANSCAAPRPTMTVPPDSIPPVPGSRAASSPAPQPEVQQPDVRPLDPSATLYASNNGRFAEPVQRVITDSAAWQAAWTDLHRVAPSAAPPVDFTRDVVILVAAGQRSTGGHRVHVEGTSPAPGGGTVVHVTEVTPGAGCMTTQVVTSPVEVVRIPRPTGPVRFATRSVTAPC